MAAYKYNYTHTHMKAKLTDTENFCSLLQTENGSGKLPFVCCKRKRKTEVCLPWSANNKRLLTMFQLTCSFMVCCQYIGQSAANIHQYAPNLTQSATKIDKSVAGISQCVAHNRQRTVNIRQKAANIR
jgi:hypothetical protein